MALVEILENGEYAQECPLCERTLSEPIYATTHFISDENDPLWRFSDAAMHWKCYCAWDQQERFASLYFEAVAKYAKSRSKDPRGYWCILLQTKTVLVQYGVIKVVSIDLKESGTNLRIKRDQWQTWLTGEWQNQCRPGLEFNALEKVIPELMALALPKESEGAIVFGTGH